jgi:hypothetical protein
MLMTQVDAYYGYNYNAMYGYDALSYDTLYGEYDALSFYGYHQDGYFMGGYTTPYISSEYYTYNPTHYSTTMYEAMPPIYGGSRKMLSIPSTYSDYSDDYNNGVYDEKSNDGNVDKNNDNDSNNDEYNNDNEDTSPDSQSPSPIPTPPPPTTTNGVARMNMNWLYGLYLISAVVFMIAI